MSGMTIAQAQARIQELEAQLARKNTLSFKVSPKGGVSVYGLGRFPVTLYGEQWKRLIGAQEVLAKFIEDNASKLSSKR